MRQSNQHAGIFHGLSVEEAVTSASMCRDEKTAKAFCSYAIRLTGLSHHARRYLVYGGGFSRMLTGRSPAVKYLEQAVRDGGEFSATVSEAKELAKAPWPASFYRKYLLPKMMDSLCDDPHEAAVVLAHERRLATADKKKLADKLAKAQKHCAWTRRHLQER